jgi:SAM-dependent methyltransferase
MDHQICLICHHHSCEYYPSVRDPESLEKFAISRCENCGFEQTSPQPIDLAPYYSHYYGSRHGFTAWYCARRRMARINQLYREKNAKLLDIGCGEGTFLSYARKNGWRVTGTELNPTRARDAGLNVQQNLAEIMAEAPFDCITLWHSLEHMRDPSLILQQAHALLAEKGLLFIAVPNARGWQARLFGTKWMHRDVPRHLYHFAPASLQSLLMANGFGACRQWHHEFEYDLMGWSQSVLNCISSTPNVFFKLLTGRRPKIRGLVKFMHVVGGTVLSLIALPLVPLAAFMGMGGTVVVASKKLQTFGYSHAQND